MADLGSADLAAGVAVEGRGYKLFIWSEARAHCCCPAEAEKVSAQKELHELHLDMQVQQERYRQLQEARR